MMQQAVCQQQLYSGGKICKNYIPLNRVLQQVPAE